MNKVYCKAQFLETLQPDEKTILLYLLEKYIAEETEYLKTANKINLALTESWTLQNLATSIRILEKIRSANYVYFEE